MQFIIYHHLVKIEHFQSVHLTKQITLYSLHVFSIWEELSDFFSFDLNKQNRKKENKPPPSPLNCLQK